MAGWKTAVVAGSMVALVAASPVAAGPPAGGLVDVTESRVGRAQLQVALARRADRGQPATAKDLRVLRIGHGGYVVAPRGLEVLAASVRARRDGRMAVRVDVEISAPAPRAGAPAASTIQAAAGPSWQWLVGDCFDVLTSTFGWSVSCYALERVIADGSTTRDYWALEHWSVTGPDFNRGLTPNAKIYDSWIAAVRAPSSPLMSWLDWSPRGDRTGSCQPIGLSVTVLKLPVSGTYEMCEQWDTTWYADGGRYRNQWKCGCFFPFGVSADREVAYLVAVSVPNGKAPAWVLSQGFLAW